jgi:hypothetical protein
MRRKIIIILLVINIIVFTGTIIMLFINPPHTYGRVAMILTSITSAFLLLSFYLQLRKDKERNQ